MCTKSRDCVLVVFLFAAALNGAERFRASEPHMGSMATITLYADSAGQAQQGFLKAFARIAQLDSILSDYNPESELSRSCGNPRSADLGNVVSFARRLTVETDGAFESPREP